VLSRTNRIDTKEGDKPLVQDVIVALMQLRDLQPPCRDAARVIGMRREIFLHFADAVIRQTLVHIGVHFLFGDVARAGSYHGRFPMLFTSRRGGSSPSRYSRS